MRSRIQQLEDALASLQESISAETHPLLVPELLSIKDGPESMLPSDQSNAPDPFASTAEGDTKVPGIDAPGFLTFGEHGESKFFGGSAGSAVRRPYRLSRMLPLMQAIDTLPGMAVFTSSCISLMSHVVRVRGA